METLHELSLQFTQAFTLFINRSAFFSFRDTGLNIVADLAVNILALGHVNVVGLCMFILNFAL